MDFNDIVQIIWAFSYWNLCSASLNVF